MPRKNVIPSSPSLFDELRVAYAADESWGNSDYFWENRGRDFEHVIIQLTLSGTCFFEQAGERFTLGPGQAFITEVPSETSYGYPEAATEAYQLRFLALHGSLAVEFAQKFRSEFGPVVDFSKRPESASLYREILERYAMNTFRDRFEQSSLLMQLFAAFYREASQDAVRGDLVAMCFQRIQSRFREPANINEIARDIGVSREHLARSFKKRYGQSPARMLRDLRIQEARIVIDSGVDDLSSVAQAVGISDVRTLRRYL